MRNITVHLSEVVVFLSAVVFVLGFGGRWHFLLDLCSHFRVHAIVGMLVGGLLIARLVSERAKWAVLGLGIGVLGTLLLVPYAWRPTLASEPNEPLRLMTLNVLTINKQYARVIGHIQSVRPDVFLCIEVNARWVEELDAALKADYPYRSAEPRGDNFGIALYSKIPWDNCESVGQPNLSDIRSLDAGFDAYNLRFVGTHPLPPMSTAFWNHRRELFQTLADRVRDDDRRVIVAGDLNCTPWSPCFRDFLHDAGLSDSNVGFGFRPTWAPVPLLCLGLPIDHILVSPNVAVRRRWVGNYVGSDHRSVVVDIE